MKTLVAAMGAAMSVLLGFDPSQADAQIEDGAGQSPSSAASAPENDQARAPAAPVSSIGDVAATGTAEVPIDHHDNSATDIAPSQKTTGVGIAEVIVTAQKRAESINRVPIAVSAFTGEDLEALGVKDTQSLSHLVPGFNANENGGNTTIFTLRGVGFNDTTYTATGTVGVYVDEVNLPYSPMTRGPTVDVKRVEVLKGPQGTLYGRNTTGGLINYIPYDPTPHFEAGGSVSYGRFDTEDTSFFVSGPITDSLRGRVAVRIIHSGQGWQESISRPGDKLGRQDKGSARMLLDWQPVDSFTFRFGLEGWTNQGDAQAAQPVAIQAQNPFVGAAALSPQVRDYQSYQPYTKNPQLADWVPNGRVGTAMHDSFGMISGKAIWQISDSLQSTTLLSVLRMQSNGSADLTTGLNVYNADSNLFAHINTQDLEQRISGQLWNDRFQWMVGVNASHDIAVENRLIAFDTISLFFPVTPLPPPLPPNLVSTAPDLNGVPRIIQRAAFINTDTKITDDLKATLAVRYTNQHEHYHSCSYETSQSQGVGLNDLFTAVSAITAAQYTAMTGMLGHPVVIGRGPSNCFPINADGSNSAFEGTLQEKNLSERAALSWQVDEDAMVYGSFSHGYKAGGFPVLNAAHTSQFQPVKQEELRAYELGLKQSLADHKLHFDLATYYYQYKNKQLLTRLKDPIFGPLPVLNNAPHSHVYGVELSAQATPLDGLYVALASSYLRTRVDQFISTNFTGQQEDFSGKPFNFAPQAQVSFIFDFTRPLTDSMDIGFGGDASYTSATNGTLEQNPNYAMKSYRLYGARVHLADSNNKWGVELWGRNLSNELVNTGAFNLGDTVVRYTGMPRTYGLTFNYNYL